MNDKTCKDCPCSEDKKTLFECHLNPPQINETEEDLWTRFPEVQPNDWCYRGREIMWKNMLYQKEPF